jgi:pyruvate dehydrogenase E1 component alpha subunit
VILCFFGDGSVPQGEFHESLNLASLWKLPVVFICENNRYAMGTAIQRALAQTDISRYAQSYAMPGEACDGMDVRAVRDCVGRAVARARETKTPTLVEARTYRFRGHSESARWTRRAGRPWPSASRPASPTRSRSRTPPRSRRPSG